MTPEEKAAKQAQILAVIKQKEASIAKLKQRIEEEEQKEVKDNSPNAVGSPLAHNELAELRLVLEDKEIALVDLHTRFNKYAGRRKTRRGGRPPAPASPPTYENLKEMDETLAANPAYAGMFLDYLIAVKSHFPNFFAGNNAELSDAVKLRATGRPFDERVKEIVRSLKASVAPRPALAPRRQLPIIHVGRLRAAIGRREGGRHRTRKSRKTRRS